MAVTADASINVKLVGDVNAQDIFSIVQNAVSPGQETVVDLSSGANTITVPTGGSSVPVACIIRPPAGNTDTLTLKGLTGDTGVALHKTNPSMVGLDTTVTTFVLTAGAAMAGVRLLFV